jgi:hypothetical protein
MSRDEFDDRVEALVEKLRGKFAEAMFEAVERLKDTPVLREAMAVQGPLDSLGKDQIRDAVWPIANEAAEDLTEDLGYSPDDDEDDEDPEPDQIQGPPPP